MTSPDLTRRQVLLTEPVAGLPQHLPMTIDFASSVYFHREGPGLLMGMSLEDEPPGFNLARDDAWIPRLAEVLARRAPSPGRHRQRRRLGRPL